MKHNKIIGNDFEKKFVKYLQGKGMFVYSVPNKHTGQPFDIIAINNNIFYGFECKHCKSNKFYLNRVEDNQMQALRKLNNANTNNYFFVFDFNGEIKFCAASFIETILNKEKYIHKDKLLNIDILEAML